MGEREVKKFPFCSKQELRRRSRLNHKAARSDDAVDTRSGTSVERATEAENKKNKNNSKKSRIKYLTKEINCGIIKADSGVVGG